MEGGNMRVLVAVAMCDALWSGGVGHVPAAAVFFRLAAAESAVPSPEEE
jgi:hypothetical protein